MCFDVTSKSGFYSVLGLCQKLCPVNRLDPGSIRRPSEKEVETWKGLNWTSGLFYCNLQVWAQSFALEHVMSVKGKLSQIWSVFFLRDVIHKPFNRRKLAILDNI